MGAKRLVAREPLVAPGTSNRGLQLDAQHAGSCATGYARRDLGTNRVFSAPARYSAPKAKYVAEIRQEPPSATGEILQLKLWLPGVLYSGRSQVNGGLTLPGHQPARAASTLWIAPQGFSAQYSRLP